MAKKRKNPDAINEHALAKAIAGFPAATVFVSIGRLMPSGSPAKILLTLLAGAALIYSEYWFYRASRKFFVEGLQFYAKLIVLIIIMAVFSITLMAGTYFGINFAAGNPEFLNEHETLSVFIILGCLALAFAAAVGAYISIFEREK